MNIHVAQVQAGASEHEVAGIFPGGRPPLGVNVIQFQPRIRGEKLVEVFRSLGGLRAGDTIERLGPNAARLSVDVPGHGGKRIDARLKGGSLVITAQGWGEATILRKIDITDGARITRFWQSGGTFHVELARPDDAPDPWPARQHAAMSAA